MMNRVSTLAALVAASVCLQAQAADTAGAAAEPEAEPAAEERAQGRAAETPLTVAETAAAPAASAEDAADDPSARAAKERALVPDEYDPENSVRICREEIVNTGSRLPKKRCKTAAQWRRDAAVNNDAFQRSSSRFKRVPIRPNRDKKPQ